MYDLRGLVNTQVNGMTCFFLEMRLSRYRADLYIISIYDYDYYYMVENKDSTIQCIKVLPIRYKSSGPSSTVSNLIFDWICAAYISAGFT